MVINGGMFQYFRLKVKENTNCNKFAVLKINYAPSLI